MARSRFSEERPAVTPPRAVADLAELGVGRSRLRVRTRWRRSSRGWYVPAAESITPTQRIIDCVPLLGAGMAIGGWAAAYILGADWLDGYDARTGRLLPVDILGAPHRRPVPGVRYHQTVLPSAEVMVHRRIPITFGVRTAFDGARWSADLEEAVVFVEAMLAKTYLTNDQLNAFIVRQRGATGIGRAREVFELARPGVRSGWESRLRWCYCREAGLPQPLINRPVYTRSGALLGKPDLFDPEAALATEFDGEGHRDRWQHHNDNLREELFEDHNVTVVRSDSLDFRAARDGLIQRVIAGYRRGLERHLSKDRWTLTPPGWAPSEHPES
ncbi:hypothetical protein FOE78_13190 [Microlunatus elymi]|uniref:DUF559 domain-containing protein n=1 Tax=Microlunatus elymi TaxID=2596828 RepID=A0A516PZX8_9ACTN|nr:hypothetical protein [Microlunatus elymi]QDP96736.1 hypothetical protein FOE78_13190 [Microlunatus elymi]